MQQLHQFLSTYRVEKGHEHTHTSLGRPQGSYYLPSSTHDAFLVVYKAAIERGEDVYLTERHRHIGPVIVDLDFRYEPTADESAAAAAAATGAEPPSAPRRRHSDAVEEVVRVYSHAMADLFETPAEFDVYVTEKPSASMFKNLVKDGLHLHAPEVVTRSALQLLLRRDVMAQLSELFRPLGLANRIEDVVDEAVIERNNWMMFGSKKPQGEPYAVTRRYRYSVSTGAATRLALSTASPSECYVELFSIRNKYDDIRVREGQRGRADAFIAKLEEDRKRKEAVQRVLSTDPNPRTNTCEDLDLVCKLVTILDDARVATYNDWVRLGWCLRNIDHRLLDAWAEISKRSDKYMEGECPRLWQSMRVGGLGIGTLHMWARQDSPERYRELLRLDLVELIKRSANATHYDVACVVHHLYRYEYACCNIRNRTWYEFKGHRWHECDSAYSLRRRLSIDVFDEYTKVKQMITQRSLAFRPDEGASGSQVQQDQAIEANQKACAELDTKLGALQLKLKTTKFKDDVMKECAELFYHERFESKLDSDINLLGFENGVYDLEQMEFRDGRPDDYVSFSTLINYVPYIEDHPTVRDIMRFWESVHPCRDIREYVLKTLASCLSGAIREERFHIWTGSGCHAAGTKVLLADGRDRLVEAVAVGDRLLGDDGRSVRKVVALCRGHGDMYRVSLKDRSRESFVVNGEHVLSLRVCDPFSLAAPLNGSGTVSWLVRAPASSSSIWIIRTAPYASQKEAQEGVDGLFCGDGCEHVLRDGDVIDVTVRAYLTHLASVGGRDDKLQLYRPGGGGCVFEDGEDICADAAGAAAGAMAAVAMRGGDSATFPDDLIHARTPSTRRAMLEAFLQGIPLVPVRSGGSPVVVAVRPAALASQLVYLSRSVGLDACLGRPLPGTLSSYTSVEFGATPNADITALLVPGSKRSSPPLVQGARPRWLAFPFGVLRVEDGDFYGFELDGNNRYLMADFIATHNSNGKSLSVSLFEKSLGQYCCKFPVTLLTQKRAASSSATPEIARAKGRRFAVLQEPSEDERLNVGQLKELSGGDTVQTRELFKAPCEWRPQFKLFLLCNQLPNVPSDDGGTWRRIRVVEFGSKFVTNPSPERPLEFPIDLELSSKIEGWKEHFMAMLVHYYKRYALAAIDEPDAVLKCTRDYQRTNDHMADFVDTCIEKAPLLPADENGTLPPSTAFLSVDDAFAELHNWIKTDHVRIAVPKKQALQKYLDRALLRSVQQKGRSGYRGFRIKDRFATEGEDDDEGL